MTSVTLFDDQAELVERLSQAMRRTKSPLLQSATGSGKTRMAMHMIDRARLKGNRAGFCVPRKTLFAQTAESFREFNIPFGCFAAGYKPSPFERVQLISAGTLARRMDRAPKLDIIYIDEAHHGGAELDTIIKYYKSMGTWVVGLSATPMKTSGQGMGEWYDELVEGPQIRWLIDNKRLSEYRAFSPDTPDLSAVRMRNGEFVQSDIDGYMTSEDKGRVLVGNAVRQYKKTASGLLNISYCTSVKHAQMTAQAFNDEGVVSVAVDGTTDKDELRRIIRAYANREIQNLCCAALLVFGFDLAQASGVDVTIESMSDLAPSGSLPWQLQKNGRPMRMKKYPAIMNDHAGNISRHGMPCQDRQWTLEAADKKKRTDAEKTEPTRACTECYYTHRPSPECPNCGFVYPIMGREIEQVEGELQEVTGAQEPVMKKPQQIGIIARNEGLQGLMKYGTEQGYKNPSAWARRQMAVRGLK